MPISINTNELYKLLERTPPTHNIMLCGKHGIGKSEILTKFYSAKGLSVVTLFLGQMSDPGDLIGLPNINSDSQKTEFLPPQWFPLDDKPIVLFLDELNRARPEILQAVMDLSLNRKLVGRNLPKGSYIISAVNQGDEYQLTDLDPALVSRFNIYSFEPSVSEWLDWGRKNNVDERILNFIKQNNKYLDNIKHNDESDLEKTPDRRGWVRVSEIINGVDKIDSVTKKMIAGIVGTQTVAKFIEFISRSSSVSGEEVLLYFEKVEKQIGLFFSESLAELNEEIFSFIESGKYSKDETVKISENLYKYTCLLLEKNRKESFAHFVSFFRESKYPETNSFIMRECNQVFQQILNFASSI